jgi:hypothetical protein
MQASRSPINVGLVRNEAEALVVSKMKVYSKNIFFDTSSLMQRISVGDTLCVATVSSLAGSVNGLCSVLYSCANNGVDFKSNLERRLSFGTAKSLQIPIQNTLGFFAKAENDLIAYLGRCEMNAVHRDSAIATLQNTLLQLVAFTFNNNSVYRERS